MLAVLTRVAGLVAALATVALVAGCGSSAKSGLTALSPSPGAKARDESRAPSSLGQATRSSGCRARGRLPDPTCTPGSVFAGATVARICKPGYARRARHVTAQTRLAVDAAYGIAPHQGVRFELDHLVPLELGGDNSQANLWPEPSPGYGEKDQVENELHDAVCSGRVSLRRAQLRIARDWMRAGVPVPGASVSTG